MRTKVLTFAPRHEIYLRALDVAINGHSSTVAPASSAALTVEESKEHVSRETNFRDGTNDQHFFHAIARQCICRRMGLWGLGACRVAGWAGIVGAVQNGPGTAFVESGPSPELVEGLRFTINA